MSLLGWLGATGATPRVNPRSLSPVKTTRPPASERTVLGILGTRSNVQVEELELNVLAPVIEAWGMPDLLILPADGDSSYAIQAWAQVKDIPVQLVACDWTRQGRRAGMLRDATIQREATHLVLLQGPRSNAMTELAGRLARKGRPVVLSERPGLTVQAPEMGKATNPNPKAKAKAKTVATK